MSNNMIRVIRNGKWTAIENTLEAFQEAVGGYIQAVTLFQGIVLVCDEEGVLKGRAPSCTVFDSPIVGDWLLCGADGSEFTDLRPADWKALRGLGLIKPIKVSA